MKKFSLTTSAKFLGMVVAFFLITSLSARSQQDGDMSASDWPGTYRGILPCASCEGIQTELTLNKNKTYDLITRQIGKGDMGVKVISGSFSWNKAGTIITLGGIKKDIQPAQYQVTENKVTQLDLTGNVLTGEAADKYILIKGKPSLEEKYWKLATLYGNAVSPETGDRKEHHIMLKAEGNRLTGSSGCNSFSGNYVLNGENGITMSKLIATKTACPTMDSESLFMRAMEFVDGYTINGDTLQIHKANATPVAKFIAVYKKQ
ncbi:MAG: copper resistance protein NlpE N-terminal domain-containing protein [Bacteroidota bacterium]|nr:copper resistance protein NlpE N-terminal domain-containing protein [Bacteroidota bacterium]